MNYFKILLFLQRGDKTLFDVPVCEQRAFLESLGTPKDDIDRGYKQYLCQNYFVPQWKVVSLNIAASLLFPFILVLNLLKGLFLSKEEHVETLIERKGMDEVVPTQVKEKYHPVDLYWRSNSSLAFRDLGFVVRLIKRAPLHPYFALKALMNITYYSDMIRRHNPRVMVQFGEFSFSSSLLTAFCHKYDIKHIDIMHGEKLWHIGDAFFHYDECYVWDEHYVELFNSLKAKNDQYIVSLPQSMCIDTTLYINQDVYADYKYYLADIKEDQIKMIIRSMGFANSQGRIVKYRPHPRYTDMELLKKYVKEEDIERPEKVGILESISNLEYAVSSYSTVLSQAYFSGKKVIRDDVTFKDEYSRLNDLGYILSSKQTVKLSELQANK